MGGESACLRARSLIPAERCVKALQRGGVVSVPTDTYYGLLADPFSDVALEQLRALKRVTGPRPWPLLIPPSYSLEKAGCRWSEAGRKLAKRFWPGKVTLVVACEGPLAKQVGRASDGAVGFRVPGGPEELLQLLTRWNAPLTGTSANPSGAEPASTSDQVSRYFGQDVDVVVEGIALGEAPSTVVDAVSNRVTLERVGAVSESSIREALEA